MKKGTIVICMVAALAAVQSLAAQRIYYGGVDRSTVRVAKNPWRNWWADFRIGEHVGLNKWNGTDYASDGIAGASMTELRGTFGIMLFNSPVNGFMDMGVAFMPAPQMRDLDLGRLPMPNPGVRYYMRELQYEAGWDKASSHFKMTVGLSTDIWLTDRISVMPAAGIGLLAMPAREYKMVLKEDGTNMEYLTRYRWGTHNDEYRNAGALGYLAGRCTLRCDMSERVSLLLGLEYTGFFDTMNFYASHRNVYNNGIERNVVSRGTRMNMLGITAGIAFR